MQSLIATYIPPSISPEWRLADFVKNEERLTWTGLLLGDFPKADVFLVGGTVRDILLGKKPKDIDLLIRGIEAEALEDWLKKHGATDFVGRFGTFKFIPHGQGGTEPIDIALPRVEHMQVHHYGGRRDMQINFDHELTIDEDLSRRDFTVNAIAFSFRNGRIIDPFNGLLDLKKKLIKSVLEPKQRFTEDATRILRGLRLASQLHFAIEEKTWGAILENRDLLEKTYRNDDGEAVFAVPREAIGREFLLGFVEHPVHTLDLWSEAQVMHLYMPELLELEGDSEENEQVKKLTENVLHLLHKKSFLHDYTQRKPCLTTLLAGLFLFTHNQAGDAHKICIRLYFHQFSENHHAFVDCDKLYWLLENIHIFEDQNPASMKPSAFEKMFVNDDGEDLLLLMQAYYTALGIHPPARERVIQAKRIRTKMLDLYMIAGGGKKLSKLLTGSDLREMGLEPGPRFRIIFDDLRDKQLLGEITDRESAQEYVRENYKK